jgi:hypothetical protein
MLIVEAECVTLLPPRVRLDFTQRVHESKSLFSH